MNWKQKDLENALTKLFNTIKPDDVINVNFTLTLSEVHTDTFRMNITYIVPSDSQYLQMNTSEFIRLKIKWREMLQTQFKLFLGAKVIVEYISIKSNDFKNDEDYLQAEAIKKLNNLIL